MIPDLDPDVAVFRGAIADLLRSRDARLMVRDAMASGGFDAGLWATTAKDLGVQGLLVPEAQGGAGHELAAVVAAVEELEGNLAPGPFRDSSVAAVALAQVDAPFAHEALAALAAGTQVTVFADSPGDLTLAPTGPAEGRLSATGLRVASGDAIDRVVLLGAAGGRTYVCCLDPRHDGVRRHAPAPFDLTRPGVELTCSDTAVEIAEIRPDGAALVADVALLLASAEHVGVIRVSLDRTLSYLRERYAFGRSVASFQAIKHQLALLHCDLERAVALLDDAVTAMARPAAERRRALLTARAVLGPMTVHITGEALRLRGGIGYTWEDDSHLFFRRARALEHAGVDPYAVRRELAGLLDLH